MQSGKDDSGKKSILPNSHSIDLSVRTAFQLGVRTHTTSHTDRIKRVGGLPH